MILLLNKAIYPSTHVANTFCISLYILAGHILISDSFWCLLLGLELLPVAPLFILGLEHVF